MEQVQTCQEVGNNNGEVLLPPRVAAGGLVVPPAVEKVKVIEAAQLEQRIKSYCDHPSRSELSVNLENLSCQQKDYLISSIISKTLSEYQSKGDEKISSIDSSRKLNKIVEDLLKVGSFHDTYLNQDAIQAISKALQQEKSPEIFQVGIKLATKYNIVENIFCSDENISYNLVNFVVKNSNLISTDILVNLCMGDWTKNISLNAEDSRKLISQIVNPRQMHSETAKLLEVLCHSGQEAELNKIFTREIQAVAKGREWLEKATADKSKITDEVGDLIVQEIESLNASVRVALTIGMSQHLNMDSVLQSMGLDKFTSRPVREFFSEFGGTTARPEALTKSTLRLFADGKIKSDSLEPVNQLFRDVVDLIKSDRLNESELRAVLTELIQILPEEQQGIKNSVLKAIFSLPKDKLSFAVSCLSDSDLCIAMTMKSREMTESQLAEFQQVIIARAYNASGQQQSELIETSLILFAKQTKDACEIFTTKVGSQKKAEDLAKYDKKIAELFAQYNDILCVGKLDSYDRVNLVCSLLNHTLSPHHINSPEIGFYDRDNDSLFLGISKFPKMSEMFKGVVESLLNEGINDSRVDREFVWRFAEQVKYLEIKDPYNTLIKYFNDSDSLARSSVYAFIEQESGQSILSVESQQRILEKIAGSEEGLGARAVALRLLDGREFDLEMSKLHITAILSLLPQIKTLDRDETYINETIAGLICERLKEMTRHNDRLLIDVVGAEVKLQKLRDSVVEAVAKFIDAEINDNGGKNNGEILPSLAVSILTLDPESRAVRDSAKKAMVYWLNKNANKNEQDIEHQLRFLGGSERTLKALREVVESVSPETQIKSQVLDFLSLEIITWHNIVTDYNAIQSQEAKSKR
ncbi:MAG: hypothetical protein KBC84_06000 [Proteobacteria bacterium]|nr:hypothetical protein [Pseudomonadota bacterium]